MSGRALRWLMSLAYRSRERGGRAASPRLTIIRHHRVYARGERPLYRLGVSEPVFAAQLELLSSLGLEPLTVADGLARLAEGRPGHWVAMSFDDGYADNLTRALPLLKRAGGRATFYLTAGWMNERRAAWWDVLAHALETTRRGVLAWPAAAGTLELPLASRADRGRALTRLLGELRVPPAERTRRLAELRRILEVKVEAPCELATWTEAEALVREGMEVGAHTLDHPLLSRLPADHQMREIQGSVDLIEERLGVRPQGLAYPEGDYGAETLAVVDACGLDYAVTTRSGDNRSGSPRFELRRRGLSEGACLDPVGRFSRRLAAAELDGAFDRMRGMEAAS